MQFVARVRHIDLTHDFAISAGLRINVHDCERVRFIATICIQSCDVSEFLGWRLRGKFGRRIERWVCL
jgi:hypothetical protein